MLLLKLLFLKHNLLIFIFLNFSHFKEFGNPEINKINVIYVLHT